MAQGKCPNRDKCSFRQMQHMKSTNGCIQTLSCQLTDHEDCVQHTSSTLTLVAVTPVLLIGRLEFKSTRELQTHETRATSCLCIQLPAATARALPAVAIRSFDS